LGGDVFIGDDTPNQQALAVSGNRIVAVGADSSVSKWIGPSTRVVQLSGKSVTAGLVDGHAHLYGLGTSLEQVALRDIPSAQQAASRVNEFASALPEGEWVEGRGWDQNKWTPSTFPDRLVLDEKTASRPVALRRVDGHALWVNTVALERAGITADTADPPGGRIVRDETGRATGVLIDAAMALVTSKIPSPSPGMVRRRILKAAEVAVSHGLTGVHEMGIAPAVADVYGALADQGRLPLRVYGYLGGSESVLASLSTRVHGVDRNGAERFILRGVKVFADGALGSRGAALLEPYRDEPGNKGLWVRTPEQLQAIALAVAEAGWQLATHAIGDAANRAVLDAYAKAYKQFPGDLRFRVEHAQVVSKEDLPRFAKLGVIASMQPTHATSDMAWALDRVGPERAAGAYAWKSLLASGVRLVAGSDFPVERVPPLRGIYAAVTRQDGRGQPSGGFFPAQRLSLKEAIRAFTVEAAYASFVEGHRGTLRTGAIADITVYDRPLVPTNSLLSTKVMMTVVNGEVVFEQE